MSAEELPPEEDYGITEADRQRMAEWAKKGLPGAGGAKGAGQGQPASNHPAVKTVRVELALLHARGTEYVRARDITDETAYNPRQVGQAFKTLAAEGVIEKDGVAAGSVTRWRITL